MLDLLPVGALAILSALIGAGAAYGVLRQSVKANSGEVILLRKRLAALHGEGQPNSLPVYMTRRECTVTTSKLANDLSALRAQVDESNKLIGRVSNWVRWHLATEKKLSLSEIDDILNGDK